MKCDVCENKKDVAFVRIADCYLCKKCNKELDESFSLQWEKVIKEQQ